MSDNLPHGAIIGVGTDLCDIRRIEASLERFGERFKARICAPGELLRLRARCHLGFSHEARQVAKLFAAKEACAKALGTGFRQGVFWRDLEVDNEPSGKPIMRLSGGAAHLLRQLTPEGRSSQIFLSLSDEYPFAQSMVIIAVQ